MKLTLTIDTNEHGDKAEFIEGMFPLLRRYGFRLTAWELEYETPSGTSKPVQHRVAASMC
jgi:hypothetical protein